MSWQYKVRKAWCKANPLLQHESKSGKVSPDCVQWIMRDAPLVDDGIPFVLEPWVQRDRSGRLRIRKRRRR